VIFHKYNIHREIGFTLVEVIICIAVLGVGVACTVAALTKMNEIASISRNMTGASTAVMSQIDLFQSVGPFNPQTGQIPKDSNNPPLYDMNPGTHFIGNQDPATKAVSSQWPIYQYKDSNGNVVVVKTDPTKNEGLKIQVTDISASVPNTYQAVVTITYTYRNKQYSFSMSALRTSDS
jgi:prepilin-type N-terminal cleavage/methylation domain-containing protein